jgi:hypothetical protein
MVELPYRIGLGAALHRSDPPAVHGRPTLVCGNPFTVTPHRESISTFLLGYGVIVLCPFALKS